VSLPFSTPQSFVFDTNDSHLYQEKNGMRPYLNTKQDRWKLKWQRWEG